MVLASNKFKLLLESGKWNAPSNKEAKILALQSKVAKLEGKTKEKAKKKPKKEKKADPAWLANKIKPQGDLTKPRMHRDKAWYWCSPETGGKCSGAWRRHKPSECKGWAQSTSSDDRKRKATAQPAGRDPDKLKLKLNQAYQALLDEVQSD